METCCTLSCKPGKPHCSGVSHPNEFSKFNKVVFDKKDTSPSCVQLESNWSCACTNRLCVPAFCCNNCPCSLFSWLVVLELHAAHKDNRPLPMSSALRHQRDRNEDQVLGIDPTVSGRSGVVFWGSPRSMKRAPTSRAPNSASTQATLWAPPEFLLARRPIRPRLTTCEGSHWARVGRCPIRPGHSANDGGFLSDTPLGWPTPAGPRACGRRSVWTPTVADVPSNAPPPFLSTAPPNTTVWRVGRPRPRELPPHGCEVLLSGHREVSALASQPAPCSPPPRGHAETPADCPRASIGRTSTPPSAARQEVWLASAVTPASFKAARAAAAGPTLRPVASKARGKQASKHFLKLFCLFLCFGFGLEPGLSNTLLRPVSCGFRQLTSES